MIRYGGSYLKEIKDYTEKKIRVPVMYMVFLIGTIVFFSTEYSSVLDLSSLVSRKSISYILSVTNQVYIDLVYKLIFVGIALVIISFVIMYIRLRSPKQEKEEFSYDGTVVERFNKFSGIKRSVQFLFHLISTFWIIYFCVNVLFNGYNISNFFKIDEGRTFRLLFFSYRASVMDGILLVINLAVLVYVLVRAMFFSKHRENKVIITSQELDRYIIINQYKRGDSFFMILKEANNEEPKFCLVDVGSEQIKKPKGKRGVFRRKSYRVVNYSLNLQEIIYEFEELKKRLEVEK